MPQVQGAICWKKQDPPKNQTLKPQTRDQEADGGPGGCGYENLTLTIVEQVNEKNFMFIAERELYWQHPL